MADLIVITGPIGAGKSTVARRLAGQLGRAGQSSATVDLDDAVQAVTAPGDPTDTTWHRARVVHGVLTGAWLRSGLDAVIAHGPFYTRAENGLLLAEVPPTCTPRRVMLRAPFEVALERVGDDPTRTISRHPGFLLDAHRRFAELLPGMPPCDWEFDTTITSANEIASTLAAALSPPG